MIDTVVIETTGAISRISNLKIQNLTSKYNDGVYFQLFYCDFNNSEFKDITAYRSRFVTLFFFFCSVQFILCLNKIPNAITSHTSRHKTWVFFTLVFVV